MIYPDYLFRDGDKVCVGLRTYQCINGELKEVMGFAPTSSGDVSRTFYIAPGKPFTYQIKESNYEQAN